MQLGFSGVLPDAPRSVFDRPRASSVELRPYQREAIYGGHAEHPGVLPCLEQVRSTLLVAATGTGKTTMFGELARAWPEHAGRFGLSERVLILSHRYELVDQARDRLRAMAGEAVELEQADNRASLSTRIVSASVQTLSRPTRLHRWQPGDFGLVIVDEAHHGTARTYRGILDYFAKAKVVGVTATPDRGDGEAMGQVFAKVAYVFDIADAIRAEYLVPIEAITVRVKGLNLSRVKTRAGDLAQDQLDEAFGDESVIDDVAHGLVEHDRGRQSVLFTTGVANAHKLAAVLNEIRPDSARAVDGGMDPDQRGAIMRGYKRGEFLTLVNVGIATEGFDHPPAAVCGLGRPTKSRALYAQMVGRVLRPAPGKTSALVIDFAGNAGKHALIAPEDLLGGKYSDEEVSLAKEVRTASPSVKPSEALEIARDEVRRRAEKKRQLEAVRFDPFTASPWSVIGEKEPRTNPMGPLATPKMKDELLRWKVYRELADIPTNLRAADAGQLIRKARGRAQHGLASFAQVRYLASIGIPEPNVSKAKASELIDAYKAGGRRPLSPAAVAQILGRSRQAGEEG